MSKKTPGLTPKMRRFVDEYLVDTNATQAAIRAGYSKKTASAIGKENLHKPPIAAAIAAKQKALGERTGITQERVLLELERLAFSNITHYAFQGDDVVLAPGAPEDAWRAVSSIKRKPGEFGTELEIRLWDKPGTLKLAGRHVGLFPDRIEVTGKNGGPLETRDVSSLTDVQLAAELSALAARAVAKQA